MAPEDVERETLTFALRQAASAAKIGLAGTLVIALPAARGWGPLEAGAWALAVILTLILRNWTLRNAVVKLRDGQVEFARRTLYAHSLGLALVISTLPVFGIPQMLSDQAPTLQTLSQQTRSELALLLTLFLACWCAAGMSSLGVTPVLYSLYLLIILGGIAVGWIQSPSDSALHMTAALVLYGLVLRAFALNFARSVAEGIAIRAQNAELVRQLSLASEAKTRFIMAASHDLRQPLHAISYLGGVVSRTQDPEDVRAASRALADAVTGLNKLFSAILDLSRIESGAVRTHLSDFRLDSLIARLDAEYRPLCMGAGGRWECHAESAVAKSDPGLLERVLRNLLDNALKHGGAGTVRLAVTMGDAVQVTVSDTGPGIPVQERERVFEEFYRMGDDSGPSGLGLGLSIVRRLVERLDCEISIGYTDESTSRGARIDLRIPRGIDPASAPATEAAGTNASEPDVLGLHVLVLDDDRTVLDATKALLSLWKCKVAVCTSAHGLPGVLASFGAPDVALIDYRLGENQSGLDVVQQLRATYSDMGIVMVTGEFDQAVRAKLKESGLPVLDKPVSPEELRLTLSMFKAMGSEESLEGNSHALAVKER